jgi:hypothetical protein
VPRSCVAVALATAALAAATLPATAPAASGFRMPGGQITCATLTAKQAGAAGLYCSSTYIKRMVYDGQGVVRLTRSGRARVVRSGNDLLLLIVGFRPTGGRSPRPILSHGRTWRRSGYTCRSRASGLTCRRSGHGFLLSRKRQRYF